MSKGKRAEERDAWDRFAEADKVDGPRGWIQWKGTDVCMDIHCHCGESSHIDGEFLYYIRCPHCGMIWQTGMNVKLHPAVQTPPEGFDIVTAQP